MRTYPGVPILSANIRRQIERFTFACRLDAEAHRAAMLCQKALANN